MSASSNSTGIPDPATAADVPSFMAELALLRTWAGSPSLATLQRRTGVPRTTIHDGLDPSRRRLPALDFVRRFVAACGCDPAQVERWTDAWRRVRHQVAAGGAGQAPRQLPATPRTFVGRKGELARLSDLLARDPDESPIVTISGAGGAGKTWLALRWAHDHAGDFPDGQLYLWLRGFDPDHGPVTADAATRTLLESLGVRPEAIPADLDARAAVYRSAVAGRRMLLLLDDAYDATQVRPLLPGSPTCMVLVTSRRPLSALTVHEGASAFPLDLLDDATAWQILTRDRVPGIETAEQAAVEALVAFCAGLPLALGIVAARIAEGRSPAGLADELRDARTRLDALSTDDLDANLRAAIGCSYRALGSSAARMLAVLGHVPVRSIGLPAAAALAGVPSGPALAALRELVSMNLLDEHQPRRFRLHDLVRLFAAEQGAALPADVARAARDRLIHYYVATAYAGERLLDPHRPPIGPPAKRSDVEGEAFADLAAALTWFDEEHRTVEAVQRLAVEDAVPMAVIQLAWSSANYHRTHGDWQALVNLRREGLRAADQLGDAHERALAHRYLGHALAGISDFDGAHRHLDRAVEMFGELADATALAHTHHAYSWVCGLRGDDEGALEHAERTLALFGPDGDDQWVADALNAAGWYLAQLDRLDAAHAYCERAYGICRRVGYLEGEAYCLDSLAHIDRRRGDFAAAAGRYEQVLDLFRELDNLVMQVDVLGQLAEIYGLLDRPDAARTARGDADRVRAAIGATTAP